MKPKFRCCYLTGHNKMDQKELLNHTKKFIEGYKEYHKDDKEGYYPDQIFDMMIEDIESQLRDFELENI